jgi:hypothetical protein
MVPYNASRLWRSARIPIKTVGELPHWVFDEFSSATHESIDLMIGCGVLIYCTSRLRSDVVVPRIEATERHFVEALIAYNV